VLDGDPAPPIFGPCLLWPNGRPSQLLLCTCCKRHFINGPTYLGQHVTERNPLEITGAVFMGDISFLSTNKPHMSKHWRQLQALAPMIKNLPSSLILTLSTDDFWGTHSTASKHWRPLLR